MEGLGLGGSEDLSCDSLRGFVVEHCGIDPGQLDPQLTLADLQLTGVHRLRLIAGLEHVHQIDFPAELLSALETVGDLIYFTNIKIDQRRGDI